MRRGSDVELGIVNVSENIGVSDLLRSPFKENSALLDGIETVGAGGGSVDVVMNRYNGNTVFATGFFKQN